MSLSWLHEGSPDRSLSPPPAMTDGGAFLEFAMQLQELDNAMDASTQHSADVLGELSTRGTLAASLCA